MAELRLENLTKTFPGKKEVRAVDDLSLTVSSGECLALLGPSGAGKSTVLRLIGGLESLTSGNILIDGQTIAALSPGARNISMAFQFPALLPQLTVLENLRLGPKLRKLPGSAIEPRVRKTAEMLALTEFLARKPETLSGGQQQRVALGRALIAEPRLLLLDEPLANLDPIARLELRETIRRIQRELGVTTVYVTHDQQEAAALADRIAVLHQGKLQQIGTPAELYRTPRNVFVAQFFGPDGMNLLRGRVLTEEKTCFVEMGGSRFPLGPCTGLRGRNECMVGFRASAVKVSKATGQSWTVRERRDQGWMTVLRIGSEAYELTSHVDSPCNLKVGDSVLLEIVEIHLFDLQSGERIPG